MEEQPAIREIVAAAIKIESAEERSDYLDEACRGDASLRAEIEALIEARGHTRSIDSDAQEATVAVRAGTGRTDAQEQTQIGPYKLLRQIGEGGMGSVWMAEQAKPVRRTVALKIIKAGMDSKQVIARFEAERQALAMMDHPNIARVLDAGTTDLGRPYFVMELVKGVPITHFCDRCKYTPQQRLRLFIDVCRAVQHAHQKGIIHRDIKPSNVLVSVHDSVPVVKVIDFGLAKATSQKLTERTLFTAFGQLVGTPTYMSPEQAEVSGLDIDTRTDVYSLGVLLYELMTGSTPIDAKSLRKAGFAEIQRLIQEQEAPPMVSRLSSLGGSSTVIAENRNSNPQKLAQLFRGDLNVIVHKSLEKERSQRYSSPNDFADDIQRFLNNDPIEARPPSARYRLLKLYQRHKLAVSTAALVALSLAIATIVSVSQAIRATVAEGVAEDRLVIVEAAQKQTMAALQKESAAKQVARQALGEMITRFGLEADASANSAEALLWFAEAAATAEEGSQQWIESKVRLRGWRRLIATPTHLLTQEGKVESLQFDFTGTLLAAVTKTGVLRVWRLDESDEQLIHQSEGAASAKWHPQRQELVVARSDGMIEVLVGATLHPRDVIRFGEPIFSLATNQDGRIWAAAGQTVKFFDFDDFTIRPPQIDHPNQVTYLEFADDRNRILTHCEDGLARVYQLGETAELVIPPLAHSVHNNITQPNIPPTFLLGGRGVLTRPTTRSVSWTETETGKTVRSISAATESWTVVWINASPDGSKFSLGTGDGQLQIWDASENRQLVGKSLDSHIRSAAFSPDGLELYVVTHARGIERIDANDGVAVGERLPHADHWARLAFGPDGTNVAACGPGGLIPVWQVRSERPFTESVSARGRERVTDPRWHRIRFHGRGVALKTDDGKQTLLTGGKVGYRATMTETRLYSAETGQPLQKPFQANALINDYCLSPDGTMLVTASARHELVFWNVQDAAPIGEAVILKSEPRATEFSRDGTTLFCLQMDGTISILDAATRNEIRALRHGDFELPEYHRFGDRQGYWDKTNFSLIRLWDGYSLKVSTDDRWLVTGLVNEAICVWDWRQGELKLRYQPHPESTIAQAYDLSPDGNTLAIANNRFVSLVEIESGEVTRLEFPRYVSGVHFSRDCQRLAVISAGRVSVWNIAARTPTRVSTIGPFDGTVRLSFIDNQGRWMLVGTRYGIQCWSCETGTPISPSLPYGDDQRYAVCHELKRAYVVTWKASAVDVLPLDDLDDHVNRSASDWKLLAETLAKKQLSDNQLKRLSDDEWQERVDRCREILPNLFLTPFSQKDAIHRHQIRTERGLQTADWYAVQWNLRWLKRLLGPRDREFLTLNAKAKISQATQTARAGDSVSAIGLWDSCVQDLDEIQDSGLLEAGYEFARALFDQESHEAARDVAMRLVKYHDNLLGPDNRRAAKTLSLLADCHWRLGEVEEGNRWFLRLVSTYENLVSTSSMDADAAYGLALELIFCSRPSLRDYDRAVELARHATNVYPTSQVYGRVLAIALYRRGDVMDAVAAFQRCNENAISDRYGESCYYLAMCHAQLQDMDKSRQFFALATERDEQFPAEKQQNEDVRAEAKNLLREKGVFDNPGD